MRTLVVFFYALTAALWSASVISSVRAFPPPSLLQRPQHQCHTNAGRRRRTRYESKASTPRLVTTTLFDQAGVPRTPEADTATTNHNEEAAAASMKVMKEFVQVFQGHTNRVENILSLLADDCVWDDYNAFYKPLTGVQAVERYLRLLEQAAVPGDNDKVWVVDDMGVGTDGTMGFTVFHTERRGHVVANSRGLALFELVEEANDSDRRLCIQKVSVVREKAAKSGEVSLQILSAASWIMELKGYNPSQADTNNVETTTSLSLPEQYFNAWNERDMEAASALFTDDVTYDDTAFPQPLVGRDALRQHLIKCADCMPEIFMFQVDQVVIDSSSNNKLAVKWHVENGGEPLPFSRGLSFYKIDSATQKINKGIDFVDSEPIKKAASVDLFVQSMKAKITQEPARMIPIAAWVAYMYIVFLSDGILPGANALQLEPRTWEEVVNLSLNFFLVAPVLNLPFSPMVHPMLEGVFNMLLAWAAMFAGFLSDDRRNKPNFLPMLPIVVGMQFLTSAFLLPYLATRGTEDRDDVLLSDLPVAAQVTDSRALGFFMAVVGSYSLVWAFVGRWADFGDLSQRWASFLDLLSIDRVGSSFLVDLAIFGLFQSWLVDDDLKRRGVANGELQELRLVGKYVPFFGMAAYLALRPSFPSTKSISD
jgi:SnoaL-like domain